MSKFAKCQMCGKEMVVGGGCDMAFVIHPPSGDWVKRLPNKEQGPCHDCNAGLDLFHHAHCDMDVCPKCGGQAAFCECFLSPEGFIEMTRAKVVS